MKDRFGRPPLRGNDAAHVVQFYTKDEFLLDGLCQFVRNALKDEESAVLVVSAPHHDELIERLRKCGKDVSAAMKNGRCIILDASKTLAEFMDGNEPNATKFFSIIGSVIERARSKSRAERVAVFGEMVAVLWEEKKLDAAVKLEELWNDLAKRHSFHLRCAYPAGSFQDENREWYATICGKHSGIIPEFAA
jgi:KaiC/GvpD/RAD55 family RecA-like ATPase